MHFLQIIAKPGLSVLNRFGYAVKLALVSLVVIGITCYLGIPTISKLDSDVARNVQKAEGLPTVENYLGF